eukprot:g6987.t1
MLLNSDSALDLLRYSVSTGLGDSRGLGDTPGEEDDELLFEEDNGIGAAVQPPAPPRAAVSGLSLEGARDNSGRISLGSYPKSPRRASVVGFRENASSAGAGDERRSSLDKYPKDPHPRRGGAESPEGRSGAEAGTEAADTLSELGGKNDTNTIPEGSLGVDYGTTPFGEKIPTRLHAAGRDLNGGLADHVHSESDHQGADRPGSKRGSDAPRSALEQGAGAGAGAPASYNDGGQPADLSGVDVEIPLDELPEALPVATAGDWWKTQLFDVGDIRALAEREAEHAQEGAAEEDANKGGRGRSRSRAEHRGRADPAEGSKSLGTFPKSPRRRSISTDKIYAGNMPKSQLDVLDGGAADAEDEPRVIGEVEISETSTTTSPLRFSVVKFPVADEGVSTSAAPSSREFALAAMEVDVPVEMHSRAQNMLRSSETHAVGAPAATARTFMQMAVLAYDSGTEHSAVALSPVEEVRLPEEIYHYDGGDNYKMELHDVTVQLPELGAAEAEAEGGSAAKEGAGNNQVVYFLCYQLRQSLAAGAGEDEEDDNVVDPEYLMRHAGTIFAGLRKEIAQDVVDASGLGLKNRGAAATVLDDYSTDGLELEPDFRAEAGEGEGEGEGEDVGDPTPTTAGALVAANIHPASSSNNAQQQELPRAGLHDLDAAAQEQVFAYPPEEQMAVLESLKRSRLSAAGQPLRDPMKVPGSASASSPEDFQPPALELVEHVGQEVEQERSQMTQFLHSVVKKLVADVKSAVVQERRWKTFDLSHAATRTAKLKQFYAVFSLLPQGVYDLRLHFDADDGVLAVGEVIGNDSGGPGAGGPSSSTPSALVPAESNSNTNSSTNSKYLDVRFEKLEGDASHFQLLHHPALEDDRKHAGSLLLGFPFAEFLKLNRVLMQTKFAAHREGVGLWKVLEEGLFQFLVPEEQQQQFGAREARSAAGPLLGSQTPAGALVPPQQPPQPQLRTVSRLEVLSRRVSERRVREFGRFD